jgi:nitroreductase
MTVAAESRPALFSELLRSRVSTDRFRPRTPLDAGTIAGIVADATQAPTSYNMQNWRFVAVTNDDAKRAVFAAAYEQPKVADASAVVVVLGDLRPYEDLAEVYGPAVRAGAMAEDQAAYWSAAARAFYADPQRARDEAIRSGSMAAMAMMLSAEGRGLRSCPMIGFEPDALRGALGIPPRYLPVMILAVGYGRDDAQRPKPRRATESVLCVDSGADLPK